MELVVYSIHQNRPLCQSLYELLRIHINKDKIKKKKEYPECGVCLEEMKSNWGKVRCSTCKNRIHRKCYRDMINYKYGRGEKECNYNYLIIECPYCRSIIQ